MSINMAFGKALKKLRKARGLTQEEFSVDSSRTYISTLERGLKSPTLEKIEQIAKVLNVHPLTLITLAFLDTANEDENCELFNKISLELKRCGCFEEK